MKRKIFIALAVLTAGFSGATLASEAIAQKSGCLACHGKDKKIVGPAFKDIAGKYQGDAAAAGRLADKVRKGGSGAWGPVPMPAHPADKINDADLQAVIAWILKGAA